MDRQLTLFMTITMATSCACQVSSSKKFTWLFTILHFLLDDECMYAHIHVCISGKKLLIFFEDKNENFLSKNSKASSYVSLLASNQFYLFLPCQCLSYSIQHLFHILYTFVSFHFILSFKRQTNNFSSTIQSTRKRLFNWLWSCHVFYNSIFISLKNTFFVCLTFRFDSSNTKHLHSYWDLTNNNISQHSLPTSTIQKHSLLLAELLMKKIDVEFPLNSREWRLFWLLFAFDFCWMIFHVSQWRRATGGKWQSSRATQRADDVRSELDVITII